MLAGSADRIGIVRDGDLEIVDAMRDGEYLILEAEASGRIVLLKAFPVWGIVLAAVIVLALLAIIIGKGRWKKEKKA